MSRLDLIRRITPRSFYKSTAPISYALFPWTKPTYLFASNVKGEGYFLLSDREGQLEPLNPYTLSVIQEEAAFHNVAIKKIFGAPSSMAYHWPSYEAVAA